MTNVIVSGDFNEDAHSKKMQELAIKTGLFNMHEEVNGTIKDERDSAHEQGSKCIDFFIETEGTLDEKFMLSCVPTSRISTQS